MPLKLKTPKEIELIRSASRLARDILVAVDEIIEPGLITRDIDDLVDRITREAGARSAPFGYKARGNVPFPGHCCISVNDVVCHGIPDDYALKDGDIVNVDVTPVLGGYHGDSSMTFMVGDVSDAASSLVIATKAALDRGIEAASHALEIGGHTHMIGDAIEEFASQLGYSVVRDYTGHGIGRKFHEEPTIYHCSLRNAGGYSGPRLEEGLVFTIEPMLSIGGWQTQRMNDGWTVKTTDGSLSAQFEHTIAITANGIEVLTA